MTLKEILEKIETRDAYPFQREALQEAIKIQLDFFIMSLITGVNSFGIPAHMIVKKVSIEPQPLMNSNVHYSKVMP